MTDDGSGHDHSYEALYRRASHVGLLAEQLAHLAEQLMAEVERCRNHDQPEQQPDDT